MYYFNYILTILVNSTICQASTLLNLLIGIRRYASELRRSTLKDPAEKKVIGIILSYQVAP